MRQKINIIIFLLLCINSVNAQLTINPGGYVTINQSGSLFVTTTLKINSDVSGSGYLVDKSTNNVTINGSVSINRYIEGNGWHNTSAPLNNAGTDIFTSTDLTFYYDETIILNDWNFGWVWYEGALSVMKGYDVFLQSSIIANYYANTSAALNTGNYSTPITRTDVANGEAENRKGWNLIGNPYPSPVDWLAESGWGKSNINDAKYIWSPANDNYTIFLGGSSPTGINGGTQYIPSNQGFWVQAIQNGNITIGNACRVGEMVSTPDYYKNSTNTTQELRLKAAANGYTDETMIRFIPESTFDFDHNKDASKLFSGNDSVPQIHTVMNNNLLAINSLPKITNNLAVNLSFSCNTSGYYSIFIDDFSTINSNEIIYLKDIREQKIIDLKSVNEYAFFHNKSNNRDRFIVYFNPSIDIINNIKPDEYFTVSTNRNTITIKRNTSKAHTGKVNLYNIIGQKIATFSLSEEEKTSVNMQIPSGYYIVSIITNNHILNSKVRITN